ncbi:MAG: PaaI family thioesterase [Actinobacteria bacterium]|nr:PaaI family thioesterase [Actinomycetota bacterium]
MAQVLAPDPTSFAPLAPERLERWSAFPDMGQPMFGSLIGLVLEEVREDYARMRLPWRPELTQPAGVMHGGAISTLIDTVVVPAIAGAYDDRPVMLTLNLDVSFLGAVRDEDAVAEGWITRRGRSVVFCEALVRTASGAPAARGSLVYSIRVP